MLILLPPSEGKTAPESGLPVEPDTLSFPELTGERFEAMAALVRLCRKDGVAAATTLGLGPTQAEDVGRNAGLRQAPAAPARSVYTGVLYNAMGLPNLAGPEAGRAESWIVVTSALWGLLRTSDAIPAYRLGGGVNLPGVGPLATFWRSALSKSIPAAAGDGLIVDLRSSTYAAFWRPGRDLAEQTAIVRVLHEHAGRRSVVSHHNKATKGRIVAQLLAGDDEPATPAGLADLLRSLGWTVELTVRDRRSSAVVLDVVVSDVATA